MSREAMQQALEMLLTLAEHDQRCDVFDLDDEGKHKDCSCGYDASITALKQALAEPEQEPVESISAEQISKMFHRLEGIDQNQWGYHWKKGWNDALREAMDYCQAAPTPQPEQPVAHSVVAGALFDFMGWLTSRHERLVLSSVDNAAPAADAIKDFAEMRGLNINDAQVKEWQDNITAPTPRTPLTDEHVEAIIDGWWRDDLKMRYAALCRLIEAAHGITGDSNE